jgi:hypothetical protein
MSADGDPLSKAKRHVAEARRFISEQKGRIARLRAAGADTLDAEQTLRVLEANLRVFEEHRDWLERKENGPPPG